MGAVEKQARLVLDNVSSPVLANVAQRDESGLKVKHALPFLRLDTGVLDENGRRAVIRGVELSVEDGTPNIVLDLEYVQRSMAGDESFATDDTMPAITIEPGTPIRGDSTLPLGLTGRAKRRPLISSSFDVLARQDILGGKDSLRIDIAPRSSGTSKRESTMLIKTPGRDATESFEIEVDLSALDDDTIVFPDFEQEGELPRSTLVSRARALASALLNVVR
jgi:hypothetical protein